MKKTKLLALAALFVAGLSFTSCKKCIECTVEFNGQKETDKECYSSVKERKEKQKEADAACALVKGFGGSCNCKASS